MVSSVRTTGHPLAARLHLTILHKANSVLYIVSGLKPINKDRSQMTNMSVANKGSLTFIIDRSSSSQGVSHLHQDLQRVREETEKMSVHCSCSGASLVGTQGSQVDGGDQLTQGNSHMLLGAWRY